MPKIKMYTNNNNSLRKRERERLQNEINFMCLLTENIKTIFGSVLLFTVEYRLSPFTIT